MGTLQGQGTPAARARAMVRYRWFLGLPQKRRWPNKLSGALRCARTAMHEVTVLYGNLARVPSVQPAGRRVAPHRRPLTA